MDGCNEVVAGRHVGDGFVEQVPSLAVFLQMVVRIDDGQAGSITSSVNAPCHARASAIDR